MLGVARPFRALTAYRGAVEFRTATDGDVDAIVALVAHAYRGTGGDPGWTTEAHLFIGPRADAALVRDTMRSPGSSLIVAVDDGTIVGCCTVTDQGVTDRGRTAYFGLFAVSPTAQGAGVGKSLLAEAERVARTSLGASMMVMTVISTRDELLAWYERRGYRRTGEITPFPEEHAVFLRPGVDVELATLAKQFVDSADDPH